VKRPNNSKEGGYRPELQELINLEEQSQKDNKGIWNKEPESLEKSRRPLETESNPAAIFEACKGKPQTGIVESVRTGSSMRITLLPSFNEIMVYLSGVQAPEFVDGEFEPFGRESKFFTEHHILNRDVNIIFEAVDKFNIYASVSYLNRNLAEELLKNGLGSYVDWSGSKSAFSNVLKAAERHAKENRIRIWSLHSETKDHPKQDIQKSKSPKEILGKVVEVLNGSTVVVLDQGGHEHKVFLSSIEVSRLPSSLSRKDLKDDASQSKKDNKEKKYSKEAIDNAYAIEARDFVRKRLIGQKVRCVFDYVPSLSAQSQKKSDPLPERCYYSVYLDKNNIAVELTEAGLAQARSHKGGEPRSRDYEYILLAEDRAKKAHKGLWGDPEKAPVFYVNDISQMEPTKAKQFLSFLKRHGKQKGVVEFEFSASRFKIFAPKETSYIIFSLIAIQAPKKTEQFGKEAWEFVHYLIHQRDIEFEVISQDKSGCFIGSLWVNKKNLGSLLLEEGFAETHRGSMKDYEHSTEFLIAEESAKRAKKNIWNNYDEAAEKEKKKKRDEEHDEKRKPKQEFIDVIVTEVVDGNKFYVQIVGTDTDRLEELMKSLSIEASSEPYNPKIGELVKAQFVDDIWYRAKVVGKTNDGTFEVVYIDYGNFDLVPPSRLRPLDPSFTTLHPQAQEAQLAYIKAPSLEEDYGNDAALLLRELVYGKTIMASVEHRDANLLYLCLGDRESQIHVNAALLRAGLARIEKIRGKPRDLIEKLREEEDKAKASHAYIWEYGDPGFDDEEEKFLPKPKATISKPKDQKSTTSGKKEEK